MEYIPYKGKYKGKSKKDLWLYLDELERLNLDRDAHTDISDVMEEISQDLNGLRRLVERYSSTNSTYVFGYAAAAISHFVRDATRKNPPDTFTLDEVTRLTFQMLHDVRWLTAQPYTLGALLSTIQMLIVYEGWDKNLVPNSFAEILQRCLKYGWANEERADLIQYDAVQILVYMSKAGILSSSFDKEQIEWFQDELKHYQSRLKPDDSLKTVTLDFPKAEDSEEINGE